MSVSDLISDIESYCRTNGIGVSTFSKRVARDPGYVARLRRGGDTRSRTIERVRQYMIDNPTWPSEDETTPEQGKAA